MRKFFVLSIAGLLLISSLASANIVSYTYNKPLSSTNWTQSFNVQKFDPTLGALNSVTISVAGSLSQTLMFENFGSAGSITFSNSSGTTGCLYKVKYTGGSDLVTLDIVDAPTYSYTAYDGVMDFGGTSGKTDVVGKMDSFFDIFTDLSTLIDFTGPGTIGLDATATGRSHYQGGGNIAVGVSTRAGSDVTVTYDYTVPEPATMLLLGLGGLALIRKHRA